MHNIIRRPEKRKDAENKREKAGKQRSRWEDAKGELEKGKASMHGVR